MCCMQATTNTWNIKTPCSIHRLKLLRTAWVTGMHDCCLPRCEGCLENAMAWFDKGIRATEPFLAALAAGLVLFDAWVFFSNVLPNVLEAQGTYAAALHVLLASWLLFNVLWSQAMCVFTPPGFTLDVDQYMLTDAATQEWRWCQKCLRGKPPLSHHCSVCNKCVLRMDHHCPWMANCVGFYNYKFFLLYLFYMWIGALYSLVMSLVFVPRIADLHMGPNTMWPLCCVVLSGGVFLAMCGMLGWHVYLVLTGQGTIDMVAAFVKEQEALQRGVAYKPSNPYHLGAVRNWKETFDVHGACWWLVWVLPTAAHKRGAGWDLPRAAGACRPRCLMGVA